MKIGFVKINKHIHNVNSQIVLPPIGPAYIAGLLEREGYEVDLLDVCYSTKQEIEDFLKTDFDIIGFSLNSYELREALSFLGRTKVYNKDASIIFGGPYVNISKKDILRFGNVDFAIYGEGEYSMLELVRLIERSKDPAAGELKRIKGLIFRDGEEVVVNERREPIEDLDSMPLPSYHLVDMKRYSFYPLVTSRGCPYDCCFCSNTTQDKRWRPRSPEKVVKEIESFLAGHDNMPIFVCDDNFNLDPKRVEDICRRIIDNRLNIRWTVAGIRAGKVDLEGFRLMKEAGCACITFGVESADPAILRNIGKDEKIEEIERSIRLCKEIGFEWITTQIMIGNPGDTDETIKRSMDFIDKLDLWPSANFCLALPYPGTRLWNYVEREGRWLDKDYFNYCFFSSKPVFETPEFSAEKRMTALRRMKVKRRLEKWRSRIKKSAQHTKMQTKVRTKTRLSKALLFMTHPLKTWRIYKETYSYYNDLVSREEVPEIRKHVEELKRSGCPCHIKEGNKYYMGKIVIGMLYFIGSRPSFKRRIRKS